MKNSVKQKLNTAYYAAALLMLFLVSLHFLGYTEKNIILWSVLMLIAGAAIHRKLVVDGKFLILCGAVILQGLIFGYYYSQEEYWDWWRFSDMVWPPVLMYLVSRQLCWRQSQRRIELLLLAICFGTFVYSLLNHYMYLKEGFGGARGWDEFWTHGGRYATEYSYWGVFIAGLLGYGFFLLLQKRWIQGGVICLAIILENYIHIVVDNRMVLMVTVVVAAVTLILYIYLNWQYKQRIKRILLAFFAICAVGGLGIAVNVGGIRDTHFFVSLMTRDGGILGNIRFQMIWEAVCMLPSHWKGGGTMYPAGFNCVHNYWLQAANDTGIVTFVLWMIFNATVVVSMVRCAISPYIEARMKYLILPLICAVISYLSMEIGGQGKSEYILFYVILSAILHQLMKNKYKKYKND